MLQLGALLIDISGSKSFGVYMTILSGTKVGRFEIRSQLGESGMREVRLASIREGGAHGTNK